jgi:SAM-dependent methyltransferase
MSKSPKKLTEHEIERINRVQSDFFGGLIDVFDPPLPEGVPERLEQIVAAARIEENDVVLDAGAGTGILIPIIQRYGPKKVYACDLSETMLEHLKRQYPFVQIIIADIRDVALPEKSINIVFLNACFPNIVDKENSLANISRMMIPKGRIVISHPMGKSFVNTIRHRSPFPLDDFPERSEAEVLLHRFGLTVEIFVDEREFYLLMATKD